MPDQIPAEALLYDWANLPFHPKNRRDLEKRAPEYDRMLERYPEIFDFSTDWEAQYRVLVTYRGVLRDIWDTPDARRRDWLIFELRDAYQRERTQARTEVRETFELMPRSGLYGGYFGAVPEETAFESAMVHLARTTHLLLHCPNVGCAAPYFFRSKKGQKFCSPACADPSRRESKRRWHQNRKGA
jgi:hypothetical protein